MPERSPKVVVVGGTYIDLAVRCSQIPAPGQAAGGSALPARWPVPARFKPSKRPCAIATCP